MSFKFTTITLKKYNSMRIKKDGVNYLQKDNEKHWEERKQNKEEWKAFVKSMNNLAKM